MDLTGLPPGASMTPSIGPESAVASMFRYRPESRALLIAQGDRHEAFDWHCVDDAGPVGDAGDVVRYPLPNGSKFPIASAVGVPRARRLIFQSGALGSPKDPSAPAGSAAYSGVTPRPRR